MPTESSLDAKPRAWVEVDLGALIRNARALERQSRTRLLPMVKADAYGLGAVPVARALEALDPIAFGVSSIAEGVELRRGGITRPVIVFTPTLARDLERLRGANLTPTLASRDGIARWDALGGGAWHLAIDTGMHRAGVPWDQVGALADAVVRTPPEGAFTHFHSAELDDGSLEVQEGRFRTALEALPVRPPVLHTENSAAIVRRAPSPWDCVRPGVFLYGVGSGPRAAIQPEPVVHLHAQVLEVRDVGDTETVSYDATWTARGPRRIATIAVGYADGYRRQLGNVGCALVGGGVAPVAGVVTMDMLMLDVTDLACEPGDVVTLLGRSGDRVLTAERVAEAARVSPYELLTGLRQRLQRSYSGARLMARRAAILVLDGVGIGAAHDAADYGDIGSNTLGNLARAVGGLRLPNLARAGLGNIAPLDGVAPVPQPLGAWGHLEPRSAGKDSTTGHWEIAGVHLARPFPTYSNGFPPAVVAEFARLTGRPVIGNVVGSGTAVLDRFGAEHRRSGAWIVYTSADSVFQVAAHEETIPLAELYGACAIARGLLVAPYDVSRVIARPFTGEPGTWTRTPNRRDFSIEPPEETLLDALAAAGIPRTGVGKVDDLFARRALEGGHTSGNPEGIGRILDWLRKGPNGLLFANLVDFDQLHGHRNDVPGFHQALRDFDAALPDLIAALHEDDLLFITADHGNDPTTPSTDHARENVPVLALGPQVRAVALGARPTFSDVGATVAEWLGIAFRGRGTSFVPALTR